MKKALSLAISTALLSVSCSSPGPTRQPSTVATMPVAAFVPLPLSPYEHVRDGEEDVIKTSSSSCASRDLEKTRAAA